MVGVTLALPTAVGASDVTIPDGLCAAVSGTQYVVCNEQQTYVAGLRGWFGNFASDMLFITLNGSSTAVGTFPSGQDAANIVFQSEEPGPAPAVQWGLTRPKVDIVTTGAPGSDRVVQELSDTYQLVIPLHHPGAGTFGIQGLVFRNGAVAPGSVTTRLFDTDADAYVITPQQTVGPKLFERAQRALPPRALVLQIEKLARQVAIRATTLRKEIGPRRLTQLGSDLAAVSALARRIDATVLSDEYVSVRDQEPALRKARTRYGRQRPHLRKLVSAPSPMLNSDRELLAGTKRLDGLILRLSR